MFSQVFRSLRTMRKLFAGLLIVHLILINALSIHAQDTSGSLAQPASSNQAGESKVALPLVFNNSQTVIQTFTGNYLTAVDGGGRLADAIHTDATSIREWERFKLISLGNDWYAIQTFTGNYLTAVDGGGRLTDAIHTDATSIREWERFKLIPLGDDWYAIQTFTANYVTAVDGGGRLTDVIHTDATSIQEWEKFRLINQGYQVFLPLIFW